MVSVGPNSLLHSEVNQNTNVDVQMKVVLKILIYCAKERKLWQV